MKLGVLGGTFDPIHIGHLRCAEEIREMFSLDRMLLMPASRPPHKDGTAVTSFAHRENMIRIAISGNPHLEVSDMEYLRAGKSFSIDTVKTLLAGGYNGQDIFFLTGQDAFSLIQTWKDWKELLELCNFIVMTRPGYRKEELATIITPGFAMQFHYDETSDAYRRGSVGQSIYFRQVSFLDISSADIRKRLREGRSVRYLVPEAVLNYIYEEGCYPVG